MNPVMILFFMFHNFMMPKFGIVFTISYFLYAYCKDHQILELHTWFGFIIAVVLACACQLIISENIFKITYKRFMSKVSDIEPFVAQTISLFVCSFISIVLGIYFIDYIFSLKLF